VLAAIQGEGEKMKDKKDLVWIVTRVVKESFEVPLWMAKNREDAINKACDPYETEILREGARKKKVKK